MMKHKHILHRIAFDLGNSVATETSLNSSSIHIQPFLSENWQTMTWKLSDAVMFIEAHYPQFTHIFNHLGGERFQIVKCDFFRYLIMFHFGGMYIDLDFVPLKPLDDFVQAITEKKLFYSPKCEKPSVFLTEEWIDSLSAHNSLHNGFLYSKISNHPLWMNLIENIIRTPIPNCISDVYTTSGPKLLAKLVLESEFNDVVYFPHFYCCPYISVCNVTGHSLFVNGFLHQMSLSTHSYVFPTIENIHMVQAHCPLSYFVVVSRVSLWK